jgi:large subunit ribosomal protein L17
MYRNMVVSLIQHERIVTTEPKAKELRRYAEKLISIAKRGLATNDPIKLLHARRQVIKKLGPVGKVEFVDDKGDLTNETVLKKLFTDVAVRFKDRQGGYTRIIKRHERRLGDAGRTAFIELLKEGETKIRAKGEKLAPTPAPVVAPPQEPAPQEPIPTTTSETAPTPTPEPTAQTPAPQPENPAPPAQG